MHFSFAFMLCRVTMVTGEFLYIVRIAYLYLLTHTHTHTHRRRFHFNIVQVAVPHLVHVFSRILLPPTEALTESHSSIHRRT